MRGWTHGVGRLRAVTGVFHRCGSAFDPDVEPTMAALHELHPDLGVSGHCSGWDARHALAAVSPASAHSCVRPIRGSAPVALPSELVRLLLGYSFYCRLNAAAGPIAERQDKVQGLALPLSAPIVFGYVMPLVAAGSDDTSTFFDVFAYLRPIARFAIPVLFGLGQASWRGFTDAVLLSLVATGTVAKLAAGVCRRAILRTGRRVTLRGSRTLSSQRASTQQRPEPG